MNDLELIKITDNKVLDFYSVITSQRNNVPMETRRKLIRYLYEEFIKSNDTSYYSFLHKFIFKNENNEKIICVEINLQDSIGTSRFRFKICPYQTVLIEELNSIHLDFKLKGEIKLGNINHLTINTHQQFNIFKDKIPSKILVVLFTTLGIENIKFSEFLDDYFLIVYNIKNGLNLIEDYLLINKTTIEGNFFNDIIVSKSGLLIYDSRINDFRNIENDIKLKKKFIQQYVLNLLKYRNLTNSHNPIFENDYGFNRIDKPSLLNQITLVLYFYNCDHLDKQVLHIDSNTILAEFYNSQLLKLENSHFSFDEKKKEVEQKMQKSRDKNLYLESLIDKSLSKDRSRFVKDNLSYQFFIEGETPCNKLFDTYDNLFRVISSFNKLLFQKFIQEKLDILNNPGLKKSNSKNEFKRDFKKIKVNLNVQELSYLFKLLVEEKETVIALNKTDLFNSISECFSTKETENITKKSINSKYYSPSLNTKVKIHALLNKLTNKAKKDQN